MSQIATALAKAKERVGHTTAAFISADAVPAAVDAARAAAIRKARNTQRFWLILTAIILPVTGVIIWNQLGRSQDPAPAVPAPVVHTAPAPAEPALYQGPASAVALPPAAEHPETPPPAGPAKAPAPRTDLMSAVSALSISAVMPGDPPRIMLSGRVVRAGQSAEGELVFAGISEGQLVFTDARGALYSRRY